MDNKNDSANESRQVMLKPEDILDEDVYEKVWMTVGDEIETDVARLVRQGRVST